MENDSRNKILNAIRSPLVFNAFGVMALGGVVSAVMFSGMPQAIKITALALFFVWLLAITIWINHMAIHNPRAISYGPREYLEESRLENERRIAGKP